MRSMIGTSLGIDMAREHRRRRRVGRGGLLYQAAARRARPSGAPGGPRMTPPRASLDEASILAEARARAGLVDFGDESFREALRRMLHGFETEADLNENGRVAQRERTLGLLVNRLRVEEWLRRHPEIL